MVFLKQQNLKEALKLFSLLGIHPYKEDGSLMEMDAFLLLFANKWNEISQEDRDKIRNILVGDK